VVGTMVGTGIFLKPAEMAREGHSVSIVFAAWIVGAVLSIFGALSYAELGAAIPEAGGEYAYLRRGFGPVWGYLFGGCIRLWAAGFGGVDCRGDECASSAFFFRRWRRRSSPYTLRFRADRVDQAVRFCFYVGATAGRVLAGADDRRELSGVRWAEACRFPDGDQTGEHRDCDWRGVCSSVGRGACGDPVCRRR